MKANMKQPNKGDIWQHKLTKPNHRESVGHHQTLKAVQQQQWLLKTSLVSPTEESWLIGTHIQEQNMVVGSDSYRVNTDSL